ncbi:peptidyl-tRNA hydrolase [Cytidiella melzeri]|nr:peptidyl-tRNA hydrolase [Cytidiella melzeri]
MNAPQLLVVGLGNLPYPLTRHSVGHLVIDSLASRLGIQCKPDLSLGGKGGTGKLSLEGEAVEVTLLKPKNLMNLSGPCVLQALQTTRTSLSSLVVIHDSLSHAPATLSPRLGGSANGHNGIRSVIEALGGKKNFHRIRIGIGRGEGNVADYVLGRLPSFEKQYWDWDGEGVDKVVQALEQIVKKGR